jgi:hypothetical protein
MTAPRSPGGSDPPKRKRPAPGGPQIENTNTAGRNTRNGQARQGNRAAQLRAAAALFSPRRPT